MQTKLIRLDNRIDWTKVPGNKINLPEGIPKIGETSNSSLEETVLYAKLFKVNFSWYIAERTENQCFGFVHNLSDPQMSEWGYFDLRELKKINVEQDEWFKKKKFEVLKKVLFEGCNYFTGNARSRIVYK